MQSHDIPQTPISHVEEYDFPEDVEWHSLEDVPKEFVEIVELHQMAVASGTTIEEVERRPVSFEQVKDVYEVWYENDTHIVTLRDGESVIGMLSYYFLQKGQPIIDAAAVDPSAQGGGALSLLISGALDELRASEAQYVYLRAQERVAAIYRRKWGAEDIKTDPDTGEVLMRVALT